MADETSFRAQVIVTRPAHQSRHLKALIEKAGGTATMIPVIEIVPRSSPEDVIQTIGDIGDYDILIFVSPNAVSFGRDYLPDALPKNYLIAAVGPSTRRALEKHGLPCHICPQSGFSSEGLLNEPGLTQVGQKKILIFRGQGGRALLGDRLQERGADVTYAEVYRREAPAAAADQLTEVFASSGADIITATSVETICNIVELSGETAWPKLRKSQVVTASARVVKKAAALGFAHPAELADKPDDRALLTAMQRWWRERHSRPDRRGESMTDDSKSPIGGTPDEEPTTKSTEKPAAGSGDTKPAQLKAVDKPPPVKATEPETTPSKTSPPPPRVKSGRSIAWLALLAALVAGALSAYTWWEGRRTAAAIPEIPEMPDTDALLAQVRQEADRAAGEASSQLRGELAAVESVQSTQAQFSSRLAGQNQSIETITNRLSGVEQSIDTIRGVSASVRNTWIRAEAEYFLQTANSRLQLAGDVNSAIQALKAADERINSLGDPALIPVRAQLTEELLAVESVPRPDIEGMTLVLNGLAVRAGELPVKDKMPDNYETSGPPSDDERGWARAKRAVTGVLGEVVRVKPSEGGGAVLLAPEEAYFLYRNLELQLQSARLALMQKDQQNFSAGITTASDWLENYFDTNDQGVQSALRALREMRAAEIDPSLPDISGSLNMLRAISAPGVQSQ